MSLVLLVGNATLDIINEVTHYPREDEELRALGQRIAIGGNAANTAQVLAQHQHLPHLAVSLSEDAEGKRIYRALEHAAVDLSHVQWCEGVAPVSYITLNTQNGSRTIVHHRDLAELSAEFLEQTDFGRYDWIHFEGRNVAVLQQVLPKVREQCFDQAISLEIEKNRADIDSLIEFVDMVMFSRALAEVRGFSDAESLLTHFHQQYPTHVFSCTWGEAGAWAIDREGVLYCQSVQAEKVVDTVAAGDVFNAGLIHGLMTGGVLSEALQYAVGLAGKKVAQSGVGKLL